MDENKYFKLLEWGSKFYESINGCTFEDFCSEAFLENPELDLDSLKTLAKKKKNKALKEEYETNSVHLITQSSKNDYYIGWLFDKKQNDPAWHKARIKKSREYSKRYYLKNKDNIEWYNKRLERIKLWYANKIENDPQFVLKRKKINRAGTIKHRKKIKENPDLEKLKTKREQERKRYAEKIANDPEFRLRTKKRHKQNQDKVKNNPEKLKIQKEKKRKWLLENMEYCPIAKKMIRKINN